MPFLNDNQFFTFVLNVCRPARCVKFDKCHFVDCPTDSTCRNGKCLCNLDQRTACNQNKECCGRGQQCDQALDTCMCARNLTRCGQECCDLDKQDCDDFERKCVPKFEHDLAKYQGWDSIFFPVEHKEGDDVDAFFDELIAAGPAANGTDPSDALYQRWRKKWRSRRHLPLHSRKHPTRKPVRQPRHRRRSTTPVSSVGTLSKLNITAARANNSTSPV